MPRIKKITTSIYCNRYKPDKNGLCVISIRLNYNGSRRTYDTGKKMAVSDFDALFAGGRLRPEQKVAIMGFNAEENRANEIIDSLGAGFTWDRFERQYLSNRYISDRLYDAFDGYCAAMDEEDKGERYSTIESYRTARNNFEKFMPGATLGDIDVPFLKRYEAHILRRGGSITTVGIYCRCLRAVMNWAIRQGKISKELYPFGKAMEKKYEIPTGKNPKKALLLKTISDIFKYPCAPGTTEEMCRDYWMFLYISNGMNVKDFCLLKWGDLNADGITFIREKTKRTKRVVEPVRIILQPEMLDIIRRWGNRNKGKENFIFPHLEHGMNAEAIRKKVLLVTSLINTYMKRIAAALGVDPIGTNDARHSFATILKNSGAPLAMISEALAHASIKTTQEYLGSFEDDQLKEHTSALTSFLRNNKKAANE